MRALGIISGLWMLVAATNVAAMSMADYEKSFIVDLENDKIPTYDEVQTEFLKRHDVYDPKYQSVWQLLGEFDAEFYATIATYGINEKRLKWEEEEDLLTVLQYFPEDWYPYIGPMLFLVPSMSDKILNMPKIKETKNKFPERIAPQLKDMEDIEFLSPFLYILLNPDIWPENQREIELPQMTPYHPKVVYDEKFYQNVKNLVRPEKYMLGASEETKVSKSDMRTIQIDKDTVLTSADVKAFANTIDAVEEWYRSGDNRFKLAEMTTKLIVYEQKDSPEVVPGLRELVNPCARLVVKAKILGRERDLAFQVAKEGFTLNEWAYTCDKVVKGYRVSLMSKYLLQALKSFQNGTYDDEIDKLSPKYRAMRYATMQALIEMYKVPMTDYREVRKNRSLLEEKWRKYNFTLTDISLIRIN